MGTNINNNTHAMSKAFVLMLEIIFLWCSSCASLVYRMIPYNGNISVWSTLETKFNLLECHYKVQSYTIIRIHYASTKLIYFFNIEGIVQQVSVLRRISILNTVGGTSLQHYFKKIQWVYAIQQEFLALFKNSLFA